jgi:hypothetical protein
MGMFVIAGKFFKTPRPGSPGMENRGETERSARDSRYSTRGETAALRRIF